MDRKDLDYQTNQEYDKFSKGSVSSATNTDDLIKKFKDPNVRIIVTTIQKLNNAISGRNLLKMKSIQNERMVFYFYECASFTIWRYWFNILSVLSPTSNCLVLQERLF